MKKRAKEIKKYLKENWVSIVKIGGMCALGGFIGGWQRGAGFKDGYKIGRRDGWDESHDHGAECLVQVLGEEAYCELSVKTLEVSKGINSRNKTTT